MRLFILILVCISFARASEETDKCTCLNEIRLLEQDNRDLKTIVTQVLIKLRDLEVKLAEKTKVTPTTATSPTTTPKSNNPCLQGWVWNEPAKSCYFFKAVEGFTWSSGLSYCRGLAAGLVKIESRDEQNFIQNHLNKNYALSRFDYWIGLNDIEKEGVFRWHDRQRLGSFSAWEPKGLRFRRSDKDSKERKEEDCVQLDNDHGTWYWETKGCYKREAIICEITH